jgi:hypothetical protein
MRSVTNCARRRVSGCATHSCCGRLPSGKGLRLANADVETSAATDDDLTDVAVGSEGQHSEGDTGRDEADEA